jgi:hypothetical protein
MPHQAALVSVSLNAQPVAFWSGGQTVSGAPELPPAVPTAVLEDQPAGTVPVTMLEVLPDSPMARGLKQQGFFFPGDVPHPAPWNPDDPFGGISEKYARWK